MTSYETVHHTGTMSLNRFCSEEFRSRFYRDNGRGFEDEGVGGGGDSALSPSGSEELEGFKCQDVLQPRVFYPFLLILVLMFLLQVLCHIFQKAHHKSMI